jgi:hypothetical protein
VEPDVMKFLLWLLLFLVSWELALLALLVWPLVWLVSLPLRLFGMPSRVPSNCCARLCSCPPECSVRGRSSQ